MYKNKTILCVIPARGGSKGVPGKNIKDLCGKPLIAYSIEQAKAARFIDRIIVDSDDEAILQVGRRFGAETPFVRPANLARDDSSIFDVLVHAVEWLEQKENYHFDILLLLHTTTPLRTSQDIDECLMTLVEKNANNVFSVASSYKNPYFNMVELEPRSGIAKLCKTGNFFNRQEAPKVFDMNSSIYAWDKNAFLKYRSHFTDQTYIYEMPRERSVDIDEPLDFKIAETLIREFKISSKFQ